MYPIGWLQMAKAQLKSNITINVLCMTHYICLFKTNKCRKNVAFVLELFYFLYFHGIAQQTSRYLLFLSLLPHKNCREDTKTFLPTFTHVRIFYLHLRLQDIQTCSLHSVVRFYLAVNIILITSSISNSEQSD